MIYLEHIAEVLSGNDSNSEKGTGIVGPPGSSNTANQSLPDLDGDGE